MLETMTLLTAAWGCVSQETGKLLQESRLISESQVRSQSDDDGPFKLLVLDAQLKDFQDKRESPLGDFIVDGYVDVDEDVLLSCAEL